jgi:hypothetical protein
VDRRADLDGQEGRPAEASYHPQDWAGIHTAEGYADPANGQIVILRENIQVREGESAAQAVARVILHEQVGHRGMAAVLVPGSKLKAQWDRLSALIPPAELQALRESYPHLAERPGDLALEWLAHQTGDRLSVQGMQPQSLAAQMWQALSDWVAQTFHTLSGGRVLGKAALDAHVRDLIRAAQHAVGEGKAGSEMQAREASTAAGTRLNFSQEQNDSSKSGLELEAPRTPGGPDAPKPSRRPRSTSQATSTHPTLNKTLGAPGTPLRALLDELGVTDLDTHVFTAEQADQLVALLQQPAPVAIAPLVRGIKGSEKFDEAQVRAIVQEFANFLPPELAGLLAKHPVKIEIDPSHTKSKATFNVATQSIRLGGKIADLPTLRRSLFHELIHWAHRYGPKAYRERVTALVSQRTGEFKEPLLILYKSNGHLYEPDIKGMRDDWADLNGNEYAGRVYPGSTAADAAEVPTVHLEKLLYTPEMLAGHFNHRSEVTDRYAWREAFFTCLTLFRPPSQSS